jgi:hypothetical protein
MMGAASRRTALWGICIEQRTLVSFRFQKQANWYIEYYFEVLCVIYFETSNDKNRSCNK